MRLALLLSSVVLLSIACSRDAVETRRPGGDPTTPQASMTETATAASSPMQQVQLIEYAIRMPQELTAGKQSFHITNNGKELHSFAVEGNNVQTRLPGEVSRGAESHLDVDLPPGTYTVYCPVANHRQRGMELQVTVR